MVKNILFIAIMLLAILCKEAYAKIEVPGPTTGSQVVYGHKPDGSIAPIVLDSNNRIIIVSS